jgi:hypothetical protein
MKVNPQTWIRVRQFEVERLCGEIGNLAMKSGNSWKDYGGEGRAVKSACEKTFKAFSEIGKFSGFRRSLSQLEIALESLIQISNNHFFRDSISKKYYDNKGAKEEIEDAVKRNIREITEFLKEQKPLWPEPPSIENINLGFRLISIVPDQKIGPLQFEIFEDILRIRPTPAEIESEDEGLVLRAQSILVEEGIGLSNELRNSNLDPRIAEIVENITIQVSSRDDIIKLGISNIAMGQVSQNLSDELSPFVAAKITSFQLAVRQYTGQFPDWIRYCENAARAEDDADIENIKEFGKRIIDLTEKQDNLIDPKIPKSLRLIFEAIESPQQSGKRAVFAAVRTVENLVSVIARFVAQAFTAGSLGMKKAVTASVFMVLLSATASFIANSPISGAASKASWLNDAARAIRDHMEDWKP